MYTIYNTEEWPFLSDVPAMSNPGDILSEHSNVTAASISRSSHWQESCTQC